jgi:hypothetical protein
MNIKFRPINIVNRNVNWSFVWSSEQKEDCFCDEEENERFCSEYIYDCIDVLNTVGYWLEQENKRIDQED